MHDDAAAWLTDEEADLWRSLISVSDRLIPTFDEDLRTMTELSWQEYGLMVHLSEGLEGGIRLADLADSLLFTSSKVNRTLDALAEREWVWRRSGEGGHWTGLTAAGRERLATAAPLHLASVRRRVFDCLEGDLTPLIQALHALAGGLAADSTETAA